MTEETTVTAEAAEATQVETPAEETKETTEETTETTEEKPAEGEPPKTPEPKKKTAQERIDEITRARREAEREREYWKRVALDKEQAATKPTQEQPPVQKPGLPQRPTLDQFETTVAYEDALFEWRDGVKSVETATRQAEEETKKALQSFQEKAKKVREEHEDFDDVIESPVFSSAMRIVLLNSDSGPEVAYFLGRPENRDVAEKIRALPPERQAYELGKLETNILLAKKTKKVPGAPPPLTPVGMTGGGTERDPSQMSIAEWMEWDRNREIERIKRKTGG